MKRLVLLLLMTVPVALLAQGDSAVVFETGTPFEGYSLVAGWLLSLLASILSGLTKKLNELTVLLMDILIRHIKAKAKK